MSTNFTSADDSPKMGEPSQSVIVPRQSKTTEIEALLRVSEVAEMFRLSKATIYRLVGRGVLPVHQVCRKMLFRREDVLKCLERARSGGEDKMTNV